MTQPDVPEGEDDRARGHSGCGIHALIGTIVVLLVVLAIVAGVCLGANYYLGS